MIWNDKHNMMEKLLEMALKDGALELSSLLVTKLEVAPVPPFGEMNPLTDLNWNLWHEQNETSANLLQVVLKFELSGPLVAKPEVGEALNLPSWFHWTIPT